MIAVHRQRDFAAAGDHDRGRRLDTLLAPQQLLSAVPLGEKLFERIGGGDDTRAEHQGAHNEGDRPRRALP